MTAYFDSSALVALYVPEPFSARARARAQEVPHIPFTPLHQLEVQNALHVLHGRGIVSARELRAVLHDLQEDLEGHRLAETRVDLFDVFRHAQGLSDAHAARLLCRSLDVLHVAAAVELRCATLVSGDDRQLALARAVGLEAVDVKPRRRSGSRRH